MNCTQTLGYNISPKISTTKYILHQYYDSQKYSFLLGDSSSISSTLDEDTGSVWKTENVSLLATNVVVAVVLPLWLCIFNQIVIFWFITYSW